MDDRSFLKTYDPSAFPRVAVAVDVAIVAVIDRKLSVYIPGRQHPPERDKFALPGCILQPDENLEDCAARAVNEKAGGLRVTLRQFRAFSSADRDPRMRVVTIAYFALTTADILRAAPVNTAGIVEIGTIRVGDEIIIDNDNAKPVTLAFDHNEIVAAAVHQLQIDLARTDVAYDLLPDEFTLFDLQIVHEAILGRPLNKPAFRKSMLSRGRLEPLGRTSSRGAQRPAELYRLRGRS